MSTQVHGRGGLRRHPAGRRARAPRLRPALVPRQRLLSLLDGVHEPAVLLAAPGGYGKTTLLTQWAAGDPRSVRWLALDEGCDEPATLAARVVSALSRVAPFDERLPEMLAGGGADLDPEASSRLLAAVEGAVPFLLVIDDLHAVSAPPSLQLLAQLTGAVPTGSTLAMAGRRAVGWPLTPLRAAGVVADVGTDELAMTRAEVAAALRAMGARPADEEIDAIADRTEGWPACVRLAGILLRQCDNRLPRGGVSGAGFPVADYLAEEILAPQPGRIRELLLRTSILGRISGPLAAFLTGDPSAADELPRLRAAGLPVAEAGPGGEWFRVHRLLRDHLRAELHRADPALERALHLLASRWHMQHGSPEDAFEHALAAGDRRAAGRIYTGCLLGHHGTGRRITLLGWRASLSVEDALADPGLAAAMAWHDGLEGVAGAERFAAMAAAAGPEEAASPMGFASLETAMLAWRAAFGSGGLGETTASADAVHAAEPPESPVRVVACILAAAALMLDGRLEEAGGVLRDAQVLLPVGHVAHEQLILGLLAYRDLRLGRSDSAMAQATLAGSIIAGNRLGQTASAALAFAALAALLAEAGDGAAALAQLKGADRLLDRAMASPWLGTMAGILCARAHRALGDRATAADRLTRCRARLAEWSDDSALSGHLAEEERALDADPVLRERDADRPPALSDAETRVLRMLPSARPLRDIALTSHLSRNTVKTHVASIYRKLAVSTRTEAVERARILGLLDR